jgi:hypothetical protein
MDHKVKIKKDRGAIMSQQFRRLAILATVIYFAVSMQPSFADAPPTIQSDGHHDFDFNRGVWHTHIKRVLDPFSASSDTMELNGTVTVREVWGGKGQLEEIEADGPKGHWEGLTIFLYNPDAHQWSQTFANSKVGVLTPPMIGSFKGGRGELFAQDTFGGRTVLSRAVWSNIKPNSHHMEESYSDDGGKTWHPSFIAELTRISP